MNKQINDIALRVANKSVGFQRNDFDSADLLWEYTRALLAELAKVSEPVGYYMGCGVIGWLGEYSMYETTKPKKLEEGENLYDHPLPQPDLVAEVERLKVDNELLRNLSFRDERDALVEKVKVLHHALNHISTSPKLKGSGWQEFAQMTLKLTGGVK